MQSHHWQAFPIISHLTHTLSLTHTHTHTHTCTDTHIACCVITDKYFPFTRRWSKITILRRFCHPFNLAPSRAMHTCARIPSICRVTAAFSPFYFYWLISSPLSQSLSFPLSAPFCSAPPHFSSVLTLYSSARSLYPPPRHTSFLHFLHPSLRGINLKPWFLIHSSSPIMTTSPALTFSLRRLSWSDRKLNSTNTLSTHRQLIPTLFCCCCCWRCGGLFISRLLRSVFTTYS